MILCTINKVANEYMIDNAYNAMAEVLKGDASVSKCDSTINAVVAIVESASATRIG